MPRFKHPLNNVRVASPCKSDWDQMIGTEQVRFCGQCNLNVYNLSGMTRDQAESVIAANEGRLCVRFYRRNDGSIITSDCPVGLRAVRERVSSWTKAIAAAVFTFLAALGFQGLLSSSHPFEPQRTMGTISAPVEEVIEQGDVKVEPPEELIQGEMIDRRLPRTKKRH